jgi:flagellar assembly protein FliH
MSERFIPKERSSEFARWEGVSFDKPAPARRPAAILPTVDQLAALEQRAHDEGYAAGLAEARAQAQQLAAVGVAFTGAVATLEAYVAESLLTLSLELTQKIIRQSLAIRPELVLPVVREALHELSGTYQNNTLLLNSADAELVSSHLSQELAKNGWRVVVDERIESGGCRVESGSAELDATLAERWQLTMATLGRTDAWLV